MIKLEREIAKLPADSIFEDYAPVKKPNNQAVGIDLDQIDILRQLAIRRTNDIGYKITVSALVREAVRDLFNKYKTF